MSNSYCPPTAILHGKGGIAIYGSPIGVVEIDGGGGELVRVADGPGALQDAINAQGDAYDVDGQIRLIQLEPRTYSLAAPLTWRSGVYVVTTPGTVLAAAFSPNVALNDDPANLLIDMSGAVDATTLNTTLTNSITPGGVNYYGSGARKISVASVGTLAVGQHIVIGGHEDLTGLAPGGSNGSAVDYWEVARVDGISGLKLALGWGTLQYHDVGAGATGTPRSVKRCIPLRDCGIVGGGTISAVDGAVAVGIRVSYALNVRLDVRVEGFSRAGIEPGFGAMGLEIDVVKGTQCQCAVLVNSAHEGWIRIRTEENAAARYHANGLKRHSIVFQNGPCDWVIDNPQLHNVVGGISHRGGYGLVINGGSITSCMIHEQPIDSYHINLRGGGICTGGGEGSLDEFGRGVTILGTEVVDVRDDPAVAESAGVPIAGSVMIHDTHRCNVVGLKIDNRGVSFQTTIDGDDNYTMHGLVIQDASGTIMGTELCGVQYAINFRSGAGITIDGVNYVPSPGTGTNGTVWLYLGANADSIGRNYIRNVRAAGYILTEAGFVHAGLLEFDGQFTLNEKTTSGPLYLAQNKTGALRDNGACVALDPAQAQIQLIAIDGATDKLGTIVQSDGLQVLIDGYCLLKPGKGEGAQAQCTGAVAVGDIVSVATGLYTAATGAARPIGRALSARSGGGSSLVKLGPV